ncbi:retron St85 family RNA-directed DNA polymerase [Clostridium sp.]|uniref:retron St85 family RNA-directed DNA polymerase n=1 Tax=Clostridium sp. TaxID=1506 RepID=UPI00283DC810|nr:retron St85 family RNA-directed DNA polymerase [Clostridium sp.]MDR3598569.1 retron St85 family RNA-directed DNA polymerase [Clostridium sp.]
MKWETYKKNFSKLAKENNFTNDYINESLIYAKNLFDKNVPIIYDQIHLSRLLGFSEEYLYKVSNASAKFYRYFEIPKKNGKTRKIAEPLPNLKEIQRWILEEILYKFKVSDYSKAYVKERSIRDNARFHRGQKMVLSMDITDYFNNIKFEKVYGFFLEIGYKEDVSVMLANLCCLKRSLPQGASTSPALSNLITVKLDNRIAGFTKKNNIRYTRYADDMTFSGEFECGKIIRFVKRVLLDQGLSLNDNKTRVRYYYEKQEVTGIIVNEKLQAPISLRKKLRQDMYYIEKYGLNSHLAKIQNTKANYIKHLLGIANFILFINPKDKDTKEYIEKLHLLLEHKEY